jgi:tungstate transport system permease protein
MPDELIPIIEQAIHLIITGNVNVYGPLYRSLYVAGLGTLLSCVWSIPIAAFLGFRNFRGRWVIRGIFSALIGIPTVALGMLLYLLFSRQGYFGSLHLLYTLNGILIGEAILVTPIIVTFTANALITADTQVKELAKTLGASGLRTNLKLLREAIWSLALSVTAAFNRGFGELGVALIVGGDLIRETNVLTTSINLELTFANYGLAMAYAIILFVVVLGISLAISLIENVKSSEGQIRKMMWWRPWWGS